MSTLHKNVVRKNLPPIHPSGSLLPSRSLGEHRHGAKRAKRDYSPLPWSDFFERSEDVKTGAVTKLVDCQVVAMDIRGHGDTTTEDDNDLSADTLVSDVGAVVEVICGGDSPPPVVIMGHSMGGAIAVRAAAAGAVPSLVGLAVIDVVEGTAMRSLASMQGFLRGRPQTFRSLEHAIEWSIRSGQLRNIQSARVSVAGQVRKVENRDTDEDSPSQHLAPSLVPDTAVPNTGSRPPVPSSNVAAETISEEGEESSEQSGVDKDTVSQEGVTEREVNTSQLTKGKEDVGEYTWMIDLTKTECYWKGWFEGLSAMFLDITVPKTLILAGVDRLDRELTIGQMQGKFQMQVLSGCGHAVHEDVPNKVAETIAAFLLRYKFAQSVASFQSPIPAC